MSGESSSSESSSTASFPPPSTSASAPLQTSSATATVSTVEADPSASASLASSPSTRSSAPSASSSSTSGPAPQSAASSSSATSSSSTIPSSLPTTPATPPNSTADAVSTQPSESNEASAQGQQQPQSAAPQIEQPPQSQPHAQAVVQGAPQSQTAPGQAHSHPQPAQANGVQQAPQTEQPPCPAEPSVAQQPPQFPSVQPAAMQQQLPRSSATQSRVQGAIPSHQPPPQPQQHAQQPRPRRFSAAERPLLMWSLLLLIVYKLAKRVLESGPQPPENLDGHALMQVMQFRAVALPIELYGCCWNSIVNAHQVAEDFHEVQGLNTAEDINAIESAYSGVLTLLKEPATAWGLPPYLTQQLTREHLIVSVRHVLLHTPTDLLRQQLSWLAVEMAAQSSPDGHSYDCKGKQLYGSSGPIVHHPPPHAHRTVAAGAAHSHGLTHAAVATASQPQLPQHYHLLQEQSLAQRQLAPPSAPAGHHETGYSQPMQSSAVVNPSSAAEGNAAGKRKAGRRYCRSRKRHLQRKSRPKVLICRHLDCPVHPPPKQMVYRDSYNQHQHEEVVYFRRGPCKQTPCPACIETVQREHAGKLHCTPKRERRTVARPSSLSSAEPHPIAKEPMREIEVHMQRCLQAPSITDALYRFWAENLRDKQRRDIIVSFYRSQPSLWSLLCNEVESDDDDDDDDDDGDDDDDDDDDGTTQKNHSRKYAHSSATTSDTHRNNAVKHQQQPAAAGVMSANTSVGGFLGGGGFLGE